MKGGGGGGLKRVFDLSSLAACCSQVRSLRRQFEFATSCTAHRALDRSERHVACGKLQAKLLRKLNTLPWLGYLTSSIAAQTTFICVQQISFTIYDMR